MTTTKKKRPWRVLIVDDEEDVHEVTKLAVKRKVWRNRPFKLDSAFSAGEARELLSQPDTSFHVALVDVVMESEHAGLELCEWLRSNAPLSLRIILRTGQPGVAPEDFVLNEYDIDQYLAKPEATAERLYASLRTSLRSSLDVAALLGLGSQLRDFTTALQQSEATPDDLLTIMLRSIALLEDKHEIERILFFPDANDTLAGRVPDQLRAAAEGLDLEGVASKLVEAHKQGASKLISAEELGLADKGYLMPIMSLESPERVTEEQKAKSGWKKLGSLVKNMIGIDGPASRPEPIEGGFFVECHSPLPPKSLDYLQRDIGFFAENWKIAIALFHLQETIVQERIAAMEAGARHGDKV